MKRIEIKHKQRFGRLVFLKNIPNVKGRRWGLFKCDCGKLKKGLINWQTHSKYPSCGCHINEIKRLGIYATHGDSRGRKVTNEYISWFQIKTRCLNKKSPAYKYYGGRGIKVSERWRGNFENFLTDMGRKPTPKHSIERINNDGNYEPSNCKWATRKEQSYNKRNTVFLTIDGVSKNIMEWSKISGISTLNIYNRFHKHKWDAKKSVFCKMRKTGIIA